MSALQAESMATTSGEPMVVIAPLFRVQQGLHIGFRAEPPPKPKKVVPKAARMLALGHRYLKAVEEGECEDFAALAKRLKVSRAWVSMCVDLAFLAPRLQEAILFGNSRIFPIQRLILIARRQRWESL